MQLGTYQFPRKPSLIENAIYHEPSIAKEKSSKYSLQITKQVSKSMEAEGKKRRAQMKVKISRDALYLQAYVVNRCWDGHRDSTRVKTN